LREVFGELMDAHRIATPERHAIKLQPQPYAAQACHQQLFVI
jgi:hypothetical protein